MECPECTRLSSEHYRLKRVYGAAVERLFEIGYQVADAEWAKLKAATEVARKNAEIAEFKLQVHQSSHARGRRQAAL
jgi:hypothetical protein